MNVCFWSKLKTEGAGKERRTEGKTKPMIRDIGTLKRLGTSTAWFLATRDDTVGDVARWIIRYNGMKTAKVYS